MVEIDNLQELYEYIYRWKKHYEMLGEISTSNFDKKIIELWKNKIDDHFFNKIKSKL